MFRLNGEGSTVLSLSNVQRSTRTFVRRVAIVLVIIFIFAPVLGYYLIFYPLGDLVKQSLIQNFSQISEVKLTTLENSIRQTLTRSNLISERAMIRRATESYHQGELSFIELRDYSYDRYDDIASTLEDLLWSERYVDGKPLVAYYSTDLISRKCAALLPTGTTNQFYDLCVDGKIITLNIYSPVLSSHNELIGYDLLAFDYSDAISELMNGHDIQILTKNQGKNLFFLSKVVSMDGDKVVFTRDNTYYWANTIGNDFYFISSVKNNDLFQPFYKVSWYVAGSTMLFYVVIVLFLLFYVVRFARKELDALRIDKGIFDKAITEAKLDHLTKIGNRRSGEQLLGKLFATYKGVNREFALFLFDIDHFKYINDTYGHKVGDDVLTSIVDSVTKDIVDKHHIFRWGGDEFLIINEQHKVDEIEDFGKKILANVSKVSIKANGNTIYPTVSMGIAIASPDKSPYIEALEQADKAMYQAKSRGANSLKFFNGEK